MTFLDVSVGGFSTAERDRIEIGAGCREFQARYAALTFVRPEQARYKYRMDGVDADWVDAGIDRTARYADLPYGTLRFRVIAANRDGVWNEKGAGITIVVIPPFYRTTWFAGVTMGLVGLTAIRDVATRVSDAWGVAIACAFGDVDAALGPEMALRLFRIVQEALNSVVKHAGAAHVSLDARVESGSVRLTVRDNGRGFDTGAVVPTTSRHGFGLVGMSERARMMGGAMTIESARGQGTTLVVVVPCAPRGLLAALSPARPRPG